MSFIKTMSHLDKIISELLSNAIVIKCPNDTVQKKYNQFIDLVGERFSQCSDKQLEIADKKLCSIKLDSKVFSLGLAVKINLARRFIEHGLPDRPICINIINPVYQERARMSPHSKENPFGENTILEKIKIFNQLELLSSNKLSIKFWIVDDACPERSGKLAEQIIKKNFPNQFGNKYHILYLKDAIRKGLYPPKNAINGSIKGASIHYALKTILDCNTNEQEKNLFLDTDADLSIHPELLGLLLKKYYANNAVAVIGSRRQKDSLAIIGHLRDIRGRLYIAILQKLLPTLGLANILDTNRAAKLYNTLAAKAVVKYQSLWQFPYQIETILNLLEKFPGQIYPQGISYFDSIPLSTATRRFTYYKQIIDQVYLSDKFQSREYEYGLKQLLLHMGVKNWHFFEKNVPLIILKTPIDKLKDLPIKKILLRCMPK
ncbi:MAG: hypothetical protein AAB645_01985 [Patescibacteria group bacterium]